MLENITVSHNNIFCCLRKE